ncbi:MAG: helix-turn-helix transcriptional regulator [Azonexaceae bacterium]|nr:helix-turn-helix transcriptional regulator [Azonexaceae bacterium]
MPNINLKPLQNVLSFRVRGARKSLGMSQENLAFQADVDRTYVSQIERAIGNPSLLVLAKLSFVLGIEVSELLHLSVEDALD